MPMRQDSRDIIVEVLNIIGFHDNKKAYAERFIKNCEKQALVDVINTFPEHKKVTFKQKMAGVVDQEQQKAVIAEYVSPEQYKGALQKASQTAFEEFMKELIPVLSTEQIDKLQYYMKSFELVSSSPHF